MPLAIVIRSTELGQLVEISLPAVQHVCLMFLADSAMTKKWAQKKAAMTWRP